MKSFAFILVLLMLSSTVLPCHTEEHDHGETCSHHHEHENPPSDEESDDHPCSPFCGFHSSVSSPSTTPTIIADDFSYTENVEQVFTYTPTYFYLLEFSIWNPPKA